MTTYEKIQFLYRLVDVVLDEKSEKEQVEEYKNEIPHIVKELQEDIMTYFE
jgi:hypothetical protein